jgi:glycerol-3-phosphate dehydrogenase (NAD+)
MRWSKFFRRLQEGEEASPIEAATKVVVFGGGSFGTAMGCSLARKRRELDVVLLLRDGKLAADINEHHCNTKYLPVRGRGGRREGAQCRAGAASTKTPHPFRPYY